MLDLKGSCHLLQQFHLDNLNKDSPPRRLLEWITAYNTGEEEFEEFEDDNDTVEPQLKEGLLGALRTAVSSN